VLCTSETVFYPFSTEISVLRTSFYSVGNG
jgi:hypothetical protein